MSPITYKLSWITNDHDWKEFETTDRSELEMLLDNLKLIHKYDHFSFKFVRIELLEEQ